MGRELRRKENKKNKHKVEQKQKELDTSVKGSTIIKVVAVVVLILMMLYYIVAVFITKEIDVSSNKNSQAADTTDTNGVSNRILASSTFEQQEEVYYVYFYDFTDEDKTTTNVINSRSDLTIYRVDTSSSLNQNYITEEVGNRNVTGITDLKVKAPTLLEITSDRVTGYYEGNNSIIDFLSRQ